MGDNDFIASEPIQSQLLDENKCAILYNATNMFECALAATIKCEKYVTAFVDQHTNYNTIVQDLMECKPHFIIILGTKWSNELYQKFNYDIGIIVLRSNDEKNTDTQQLTTFANVFYMEPPMFTKIVPCRSEISAYIIFSHLMRSEFPKYFTDGLEDAHYFRLALRSSIKTPSNAWTFINNIVSNWQQVMEAENLVIYGRFLSNVGTQIAQKRMNKKSILIQLGKYQVRLICSDDYHDIIKDIAFRKDQFLIIYTISADTLVCILTCFIRDDIKDVAPCNILELIAPHAQGNELTCITNDFFALIRKIIIKSKTQDNGAQSVISEGEKVLSEAALLLERKN